MIFPNSEVLLLCSARESWRSVAIRDYWLAEVSSNAWSYALDGGACPRLTFMKSWAGRNDSCSCFGSAGLPSDGVQNNGRQPSANNEHSSNRPGGSERLPPEEKAAQNGDRTLPVGDRRILHGGKITSSHDQEPQCEQAAHDEEGYCPHPVGGSEGRNAVPRTQDD